MCAVSMVYDKYRHKYPLPDYTQPIVPLVPNPAQWQEILDAVKRAREQDIKDNAPDCVDPKKEEWMKKMSKSYDETYGS